MFCEKYLKVPQENIPNRPIHFLRLENYSPVYGKCIFWMKPSATSVPRNILQCELPCVHKQLVLNSPLKEDIIFTKLLVVL